ncbi:hypothetical protein QBC32DRAFT_374299 [Pseudoneurospora amorphoporcata]|uniref:Uncharacterized protein n=1 Tax=Pseudoneurospora amorphoporcata TaxID=241081 RepID=A0AAN6SC28_9PEZI|nr:hypothetical protein QBC32DRAFT_374299 [Pseudoneurospora amorphoporcata]
MESSIMNPMFPYNKHSSKDSPDRIAWKPGGIGIAIGVVLESDGGLEKDWSGLKQPGVQVTMPVPVSFNHATIISMIVVSVFLNNTIDVPITLNVSSLWRRKYGSLDVDYTQPIGLFAPGFSDVVRDYLDKAPMRIPGINCENCILTIKVFPKNLIFETTVMPIMNEGLAYTPATISTNNSIMKITTRRKADTHCNGTFLTHTCILNPRADLLYPTENTVLPLWHLGTSLFNSSSWMQFDFTYGYAMNYEGLITNLYTANWTTSDFRSLCYQYFNDPMDYIINSYREIAFRMSIRVPYTRHSTQVQYTANRLALALAVIVSLVGPVAILFLFRGWWRLGRDFSINPTPGMDGLASDDASIHDETPSERPSKNYNSVSGNASADELANHFRHLGQTKNLNDENEKEEQEEEPKVQYGVVESGTGEHLGFAVVSGSQGVAVRRSWKGESL